MDEKYNQYLCSREWSVKKLAIKNRCGGICERCRDHLMQHVHHLTYARKYNERLDDLQGVCKGCHDFIYAITNVDPKERADKCRAVAAKLLTVLKSQENEVDKTDVVGAVINFHRWRQGIAQGRSSGHDHIWQREFCETTDAVQPCHG